MQSSTAVSQHHTTPSNADADGGDQTLPSESKTEAKEIGVGGGESPDHMQSTVGATGTGSKGARDANEPVIAPGQDPGLQTPAASGSAMGCGCVIA